MGSDALLIYRNVFGDFEIDINKAGLVVNVLIKQAVGWDEEHYIFHSRFPGGSPIVDGDV